MKLIGRPVSHKNKQESKRQEGCLKEIWSDFNWYIGSSRLCSFDCFRRDFRSPLHFPLLRSLRVFVRGAILSRARAPRSHFLQLRGNFELFKHVQTSWSLARPSPPSSSSSRSQSRARLDNKDARRARVSVRRDNEVGACLKIDGAIPCTAFSRSFSHACSGT